MSTSKPEFQRITPPYKVFSTWEIHYGCNYQCSYCHAPKPDNPNVKPAAYLPIKEWLRIWDGLYDKYGPWEIIISGGEPFTYPNFTELIARLQGKHVLEIVTNLSWDVKSTIKEINPGRVKIGTSFHSEFADIDDFCKKVKLLKERGFDTMVNFVPWPMSLQKMAEYKNKIENMGVAFVLQPFIGQYEGRQYPRGYTEKEQEYFKIFKDECNINALNFKTDGEKKPSSTTGKICRMGQNYAFIHPNGEVHRCCRDKSFSLGNVVTGTFKLLDEPVACAAGECNCWRCMLAGKEDEWVGHWGRKGVSEEAVNLKQKKTDIVLIQPLPWGVFDPPVGLAQLSGCLKEKGYSVSSYDLNIKLYNNRKEKYKNAWAIEQSSFWNNRDNVLKYFESNEGTISHLIEEIIAMSPRFVCFSVNTCAIFTTFEFARMLKEKMADIKVILGGPQFFVSSDENIEAILQEPSIDVIICGEGEKTLLELIDAFVKGQDISSHDGIYFKKNNQIIKTQQKRSMQNLDELPFLDFSDLPLKEYEQNNPLGKHLSIMTSRGCCLNCVFCGPKAYWPGYHVMSGWRIYSEIRYHLTQNPDIEHVEFLDLLFNGNMKLLIEFCDLMISEPIKEGLKWHANAIIRPEMTREVIEKMKKAGCFHLSFGIESGSQNVLNLMKKRYKTEDADKVLRYAHESGIQTTCNFMFGFPGETENDFKNTLEFLERNKDYINFAYPSRTFCTIEPNSYLEKNLEEFGVIPNPIHGQYWESKDGKNTYPERMRRCEEFSLFAERLGVNVGLGLQTSVEHDKWLNLGNYYDSKKDYKKAIECFNNYLTLDPKNEVIRNKIETIKDYSLFEGKKNGQISFNWDIHYICNYRCPYCWFYNKWTDLRNNNSSFSIHELVSFWEKMYSDYGPVKLGITGGEPFLYPGFIEIIGAISKQHEIEIITNLSADVDNFIEKVNSSNVKVHPSFHPLFSDFDKFIGKILKLRQKGFSNSVSYLAWPPQIPKIKYFYNRFKEFDINLFVQSFFGEYKGLKYPEGYTKEEKEAILPFLGERGGKPFQTEPLNTKGKLCSAGYRYGIIHPDGRILRCGGINSLDGAIGNLQDKDFKLLDKSKPCVADICPCNEWAFLLEECEMQGLNCKERR